MTQGLLDKKLLNGARGIRRKFGPARRALFVDRTSIDDAVAALDEACQIWGGASTLLVPAERGATSLRLAWQTIFDRSVIDAVLDRRVISPELARRLGDGIPALFVGGSKANLLPTLAALTRDPQNWLQVEVAELAVTDPWHVGYAGVLGHWPESPDNRDFDHLGFLASASFSDFVPCHREDIAQPDGTDLLRRLRDALKASPASISMAELQVRRTSGTLTSGNEALPERLPEVKAVGPSIVVVYRTGSVEDLCLLWNLRWAFGLPYGAPLAVPVETDVEGVINHWLREVALFPINASGSYFALTSFSLDQGELRSIVKKLRGDWHAESPESLFGDSDRATRTTSDVGVFEEGRLRLPAWHSLDRQVLHDAGEQLHTAVRPISRFEIYGERIPSFPLEGMGSLQTACRGGGLEVPAGEPTRIATVEWPSGWEVLTGLLDKRSLLGEPSQSGLIAAGLLGRLGSVVGALPLVSREVFALLYELAERRGTSRFKRQVRDLARGVAAGAGDVEEKLGAIEERLAELSLSGSEEERLEMSFDVIAERMRDRSAAGAWVRWAERIGLLLRGLSLKCNGCGRESWKPLVELAPPWICRWCGSDIRQPFPEGQAAFRYAGSSTTLSLVGEDALGHLLAQRWLHTLLGSYCFGAYPSVRIRRGDSNEEVGEADVLLVLADGSMVPGECKLSSTGWNETEARKLDDLADALDAPWTFIATPQWGAECTEQWMEAPAAQGRPRFALTGEHLFELEVFWALGTNPFAWRSENDAEHAARRTTFNERLPNIVEGLDLDSTVS